ncbi:DUF885 family protein [Caulobacter sp. 17J80-11]|uniref:DUF885 domain-containing protein n=1 Tax=Caulobacter sp. 17J80-11 TaxID=2763502 RepID=UPI001653E352|nr:DUF885 family protein [Caulobacter sp. 17J80-11]MBC6982547.1 DUF885 family protein [Caulobacter sp. 17J80-11]
MIKSAATALALVLAPVAAVAVVATPAAAQQQQSAATAQWRQIVADWEAAERAEDPISSGSEGDAAALSKLPDITPAGDARRTAVIKAFQARLKAVPVAQLSAEDAFNHAFLSRIVNERLEGDRFDGSRLAFDSEGGPGTMFGYLARSTPISSKAEAEAWLARMDGAAKYYADSQANARRGIKTGFTQPKSTVESALTIAQAEAAFSLDQDPMLIPLAKLPDSISAADQAALRDRARKIIVDKIQPARREWVRFLKDEYMPKARPGLGVSTLPDGKAYYAWLARGYTTTDLTPDQIHEIGKSEVARIRAEMDKEIAASGFKGTFPEFLHWLRTDPRFYAQSREDLMEKASEIAKRSDDQLPRLFKTLPRLTYGVRPVPREIEENYTTGRYSPGSPQLGIAGGYLVNTSKLDQRPLYELPALTLHEAVPGHHLQIALAQEAGDQPWFRRNANVTAYTEGWGLYSEFLGYEMGMYRDPYERFGKLSYEMWRACRLVADTGIHAKGWTIEQARACFRDNSALAPHNIETELQRYISWPGQALGYKIGELKLKELRKKAEAELGPDFNVREFHDAVLLEGAMPLSLLEQHIDEWIAEKKAK